MPHELPNDLRLGILGNEEILRKSQICVKKSPSAQSPSQKLNFDNSSQKHTKVDIKLFLSCPILMDSSMLFQIFCPGL